MEQGQQSIILRKGGISEGKHGFQWLHPKFFLFPSYFHEQEKQLNLKQPLESPETPTKDRDDVEIRLFAKTVRTIEISELKTAEQLAPFHVWKPSVVEERFGWGESQGLSLAIVRVCRLETPWVLKNRTGFGGCRSWLGLPREEGLPDNWHETLQPVLSDEEFGRTETELAGLGFSG